jgi:hypothetical protein
MDSYVSLPSGVLRALSPMLSSAIILWLHAVEIWRHLVGLTPNLEIAASRELPSLHAFRTLA